MDTFPPAGIPPTHPSAASAHTQATWEDLLHEMAELHARLEYLRVMLKIGVRNF